MCGEKPWDAEGVCCRIFEEKNNLAKLMMVLAIGKCCVCLHVAHVWARTADPITCWTSIFLRSGLGLKQFNGHLEWGWWHGLCMFFVFYQCAEFEDVLSVLCMLHVKHQALIPGCRKVWRWDAEGVLVCIKASPMKFGCSAWSKWCWANREIVTRCTRCISKQGQGIEQLRLSGQKVRSLKALFVCLSMIAYFEFIIGRLKSKANKSPWTLSSRRWARNSWPTHTMFGTVWWWNHMVLQYAYFVCAEHLQWLVGFGFGPGFPEGVLAWQWPWTKKTCWCCVNDPVNVECCFFLTLLDTGTQWCLTKTAW